MMCSLESDEVHTWYRWTDNTSEDGFISEDVLSADERARRDRFRFQHDRRDFASAHDLLRRSLSKYVTRSPASWAFTREPLGKPYLDDRELSFNLSHTRGLVACAIARSMSVGIDAQQTDARLDWESLQDVVLAKPEALALQRTRVGRRTSLFFDLWTLKEAFTKATGLGLSIPLTTIAFDLDHNERSIRFNAPRAWRPADWQFALYAPSDTARIAVAVYAPDRHVRCRAQIHNSDARPEIQPILTRARPPL